MLIIDMPMPKNCEQCPLAERVYSDCENFKLYCLAGEERKEIITLGIPVWCPIKGELVRCGECKHYHDEDDPPYCDELCTIHVEKTDGCLRGIKRGAEVGYRAEDGERKDDTV